MNRRRKMYHENCIQEKTRHQKERNKETISSKQDSKDERSSEEEHREDALALRAEERRDKLRKAVVRSKYPETHGCLNGETRL